MTRMNIVIIGSATATWMLAFAWPVVGMAYPRLGTDVAPGLHMTLTMLAAALTISYLVSRLIASHTKAFAIGMMSMADRQAKKNGRPWTPAVVGAEGEAGIEDVDAGEVVNLRRRTVPKQSRH